MTRFVERGEVRDGCRTDDQFSFADGGEDIPLVIGAFLEGVVGIVGTGAFLLEEASDVWFEVRIDEKRPSQLFVRRIGVLRTMNIRFDLRHELLTLPAQFLELLGMLVVVEKRRVHRCDIEIVAGRHRPGGPAPGLPPAR